MLHRHFDQKKTTVFPFTSKKLQLVSWWFFTNPFEKKCDRQNGWKWVKIFPNVQGEHSQKYLNIKNIWGTPPPSVDGNYVEIRRENQLRER